MHIPFMRRRMAPSPKGFFARDVMFAVAAIGAVILFNCGVVRALDVALDAIHR